MRESKSRHQTSHLVIYAVATACLLVGGIETTRAQSSANRLPLDDKSVPAPSSSRLPLRIDHEAFASEIPEGASGVRLMLAAVVLQGNVVISTASLQHLWTGMVGSEVSLTDIFKLASRITATYRNEGYVLSQVIVPVQQFEQNGARVTLRVVEGYIGRISVSGLPADAKAQVLATLSAMTVERPLTQQTLERRLLLLNDLPGLMVSANLKPGQSLGESDMEIVGQRDQTAYSAGVHNHTSEAVGHVRFEFGAERRGLLGVFDRHGVRLITSGDQQLKLLAYSGDVPISHDGVVSSWALSKSRSKPTSGAVFQLDTDATNASLGLSYPVWRSRQSNLALRGTFSGYDGETNIATSVQLSKDKLRVVRLGSSIDVMDDWNGINLVDIEFSKGVSWLGASRPGDLLLQRAGSNPQFTKTSLYAARLQSLGGNWSALIAGTGQYSRDLLSSSEQFGLGGELFLRAYDPSELLGDSGAASKFELRYNAVAGPINLLAYGFFESGVASLNSSTTTKTSTSAQSYGLGLRFSMPHGAKGYVEVAKPRNRSTLANGNLHPRGFAGLSFDF